MNQWYRHFRRCRRLGCFTVGPSLLGKDGVRAGTGAGDYCYDTVNVAVTEQSRFNYQCTRQAKSAAKPSTIPAFAGIHTVSHRQIYPFQRLWIPVSTGMTPAPVKTGD